ncbi:MAG TPA: PKD domain-containing protein [Verrucomicrobiae bacterium]|jgi:PKD repeat protein
MTKVALSVRRCGLKLGVLALLALPELAGAQTYFNYNETGDVLAGFRKTGTADTTANEMVSDLGNVTNYLALSAGTTITITNFTAAQLTYAFANYNNLQWSAFTTFQPGGIGFTWKTPLGNYPNDTMWLTLPDTSLTVQTTPPSRQNTGSQANQVRPMLGVGQGAVSISGFSAESPYNTNNVIVEPESYNQYDLTAEIGDANNTALGDFGSGGVPLPYSVENTTPASFTSSQRSDFYQLAPSDKTDPITLQTGATPYFVGYFILNSAGTLTFTRASAVTAPAAGTIAASATNGFGPLTVVFTNTASGTITDWVWNFGNGTIITNTTGGGVTNTYATAGNYTVTLTVYGPGGTATNTVANFIVASPKPKINLMASSGQIVFSGTNCPVGVKYRILSSTNLLTVLPGWKPVYTNTFASNGAFSYTNTVGSGKAYFILVSP